MTFPANLEILKPTSWGFVKCLGKTGKLNQQMCLDLYNEFVKCIECSLPQPTHLVSSGKKDSMGGPVGLKIPSNTGVLFPLNMKPVSFWSPMSWT